MNDPHISHTNTHFNKQMVLKKKKKAVRKGSAICSFPSGQAERGLAELSACPEGNVLTWLKHYFSITSIFTVKAPCMQQKKHSKEIKLHSQLLRWDNESGNWTSFSILFIYNGETLKHTEWRQKLLFESNSVTDLDFTALWIHFGSQYCRKMS